MVSMRASEPASRRPMVARAQPRVRGESDLEIGCLVPIGLALAVAIGIGVLVGTHLPSGPAAPREIVVRVIDDGARDGPAVLSTQVVPLR
jgi:hypothetical protein